MKDNELTGRLLAERDHNNPSVDVLFYKDGDVDDSLLQDQIYLPGQATFSLDRTNADWVLVVPPGAKLESNAIATFVSYINTQPLTAMWYADNEGSEPFPPFNKELWLANGPMPRVVFVHVKSALSVNAFPEGLDAQVWVLDAAMKLVDDGLLVQGIPEVLTTDAPSAHQTVCTFDYVDEYLKGVANVDYWDMVNDISYRAPGGLNAPQVLIVIPTKDQPELLEDCLTSLKKTRYPDYSCEILIIDNNTTDNRALDLMSGYCVFSYQAEFNYADMHNRAIDWYAHTVREPDIIVFLNNDTRITRKGWLQALVNAMARPNTAAAGPLLTHEDGTVQHAGVVLGLRGAADHIRIGEESDMSHWEIGYQREVSAVTAACMAFRYDVFAELGGFDDENFPILFNDVDLCVRARESGWDIIYTPHTQVVHKGSKSLKAKIPGAGAKERERMEANKQPLAFMKKWPDPDQYFSRRRSLRFADGRLDEVDWDWNPDFKTLPRILAYPGPEGGSSAYRIIQPLEALRSAGKAHVTIIPYDMPGRILDVPTVLRMAPDVIVMHQPYGETESQALAAYRQATSDIFLVADIDDLVWDLPEYHPGYGRMEPDKLFANMARAHRSLNRVTTTTLHLSERLDEFFPDIPVCVRPNMIDTTRWLHANQDNRGPSRTESARPRIGWVGAAQHQGDLELITDAVKATYKEVDWVFMGNVLDTVRPYVKELVPACSIEQYPGVFASLDLDLMVVPLQDNAFNACKSNLHLLESAMCGYPVVASDVLPYRGSPVRHPQDEGRWEEMVRATLTERGHALGIACNQTLREHVLENYLLQNNLDDVAKSFLP